MTNGQWPRARRDQRREREGEADGASPGQDDTQVLVGPAEGRVDLGLPRHRDGEREHAIQVEAGRGERSHSEHARDQQRAPDDMELSAVQDVDLDVEHGHPDPHGRHDLDQGEPPIRVEQLDALEQHEKGTDDQAQRGEPTPARAQLEHRILHGGVVTAPDGVDQPADGGRDAVAASESGVGGNIRSGGRRRAGGVCCSPFVIVRGHVLPFVWPTSPAAPRGCWRSLPAAAPRVVLVIVTPDRRCGKEQRLSGRIARPGSPSPKGPMRPVSHWPPSRRSLGPG